LPNFSIVFGGREFVLTPDDYVLRITQRGQTTCLSGFVGMPLGTPEDINFSIIGDTWISKFYSVFDASDKSNVRVRIAESVQP
jgi:cathepsin D